MATKSRLILASVLLVHLVSTTSGADAQERFNLQTFRPTPAQRAGMVNVHGARLLAPLDFDLHLMGSLGWSPFEIETPDGLTEGKVVSSIVAGDLLFAIGLHERFDVGLDIGLLRMQQGDGIPGFREPVLDKTRISLGDIRIVPRILCYSTFEAIDDDTGWALSVVLDSSIPTGAQDAYAGDGGLRLDPRIAFQLGLAGGHTVAVNAGYTIRPATEIETLEVDDALALSAGGEARLLDWLRLVAEVDASITLADDLGSEEIPVEFLAGGRLTLGPFLAQLGMGAGLSEGVGSPDIRVYGAVGYLYVQDTDDDDDGILDRDDRCPEESEDPDGFEDLDGCPDPDNDADGVLDLEDACPDLAEDANGLQDEDGCPEADTDGDAVPDPIDGCPAEAEDADGFEDADGCPDPDNDGDGFPDEVDVCPLESGPDNGCPVVLPPLLETVVHFDTGSSEIKEADRVAIDAFARSFGQAPAGARIAVTGHTDDTGRESRNAELSLERARAVRDVLVTLGIDTERIAIEGQGSAHPVATNDSEEGRAANRRAEVRLVIGEW